jgi:hypothetical protein
VNYEFVDSRESYENVDDPFYLRHGTKYQVNNVPIAPHKSTEAHESPIESPDDDEDPSNHVQPFIIHMIVVVSTL